MYIIYIYMDVCEFVLMFICTAHYRGFDGFGRHNWGTYRHTQFFMLGRRQFRGWIVSTCFDLCPSNLSCPRRWLYFVKLQSPASLYLQLLVFFRFWAENKKVRGDWYPNSKWHFKAACFGKAYQNMRLKLPEDPKTPPNLQLPPPATRTCCNGLTDWPPHLLVGTFAPHPKKRAPPREISSKSRSNPNINDWNPIFEADLNRLFDLGFLEACLQLDQKDHNGLSPLRSCKARFM